MEAITFIKEHPQEAKVMGENGKQLVQSKFNWEVESEKLIKLYKEIMNKK